MLENFRGIKIKGRCFENETTLEFFPKNNAKTKDNRVALVFGRNGAGKTTVARAFTYPAFARSPYLREKIHSDIIGDISCDELRKATFIFNEDYINEKIVINEDHHGLGSIILFGEQSELAKDIKIAEEGQLELLNELSRHYPKYPTNKVTDLRDLCRCLTTILGPKLACTLWSNRSNRIHPGRREQYLTPDFIKRLYTNLPVSNREATERRFAAKAKKLDKLREDIFPSVQERKIISELQLALTDMNASLTKAELLRETPNVESEIHEWLLLAEYLTDKSRKWKELIVKINELKDRAKQVTIAADKINAALAYIFMSGTRLNIKLHDNFFRVYANGHPVEPRDISIGERNALAIAYFFSDMMNETDATTAYRQEHLVFIDDPISSFDHENKMGVLSYIMHEMENLKNSRFICFMHDLHSFMALASSIKAHDGKNGAAEAIGQFTYTLNAKRGGLKPLNLEATNEYRFNFDEILEYAAIEEPEENVHVGNQMRRILEAYSTFVYRKGFEYLFYGELIRGENAKHYNDYFKNIFSRFVVNDESHLQGRIRSLTNCNSLLAFIDDHERQRAIRDSICLLYLINPEHVLSLRDKEEEKSALQALIEPWLAAIRENAPSVSEGVTNEA